MAQMPEIKADVNKEPEREKKRPGFLARLFGGGGGAGSGAMGAGGFGAGGGGLLATKAGLLAVVLVGTTVAGGVGLVGYRLFGPGSEPKGDNMSLFAVREKKAAPSSEDASAAPKDGTSASLQYLAEANKTPGGGEAKPAEAPKDATAASAAASSADAVKTEGSNGPLNAAGSSGNGVNKNLLKTSGQFGALSKNFGGGGGGPMVSAGPAKPSGLSGGDAAAQAAKNGSLGAMSHKGVASTAGKRAIGSRRGSGAAVRQAMGALRDNRGATTSYGAGRTYDGSAANNTGNIGPTGSEIGMGGPGDSSAAQPKSMPNSAAQNKEFKAPPSPTPVDAAPWQNAINTARMLIGVAVALMLVAKLLAKSKIGQIAAYVVAAIVAVIGAAVIALGSQIANGQYGQKAQGGLLGCAGLGLIVAAAAIAFGADKGADKGTGLDTNGSGAAAAQTSSGTSNVTSGLFDNVNPWVLIGGGLGLAGMVGSMMAPVQKYPSTQFENGNPPDAHWFGYRELPSETAVKTMVG